MTAHILTQGAPDACIIPSRRPNGMHHVRDALRSWVTPVQDSAESKATRHHDSPTDQGPGVHNPQCRLLDVGVVDIGMV
jgi:hypothetical protein